MTAKGKGKAMRSVQFHIRVSPSMPKPMEKVHLEVGIEEERRYEGFYMMLKS